MSVSTLYRTNRSCSISILSLTTRCSFLYWPKVLLFRKMSIWGNINLGVIFLAMKNTINRNNRRIDANYIYILLNTFSNWNSLIYSYFLLFLLNKWLLFFVFCHGWCSFWLCFCFLKCYQKSCDFVVLDCNIFLQCDLFSYLLLDGFSIHNKAVTSIT